MINKQTKNISLDETDKKISLLINQINSEINIRESYLSLGDEMLKLEQIDNSIKFYQCANKIKEDNILLYNIGCLYYKQGNYKKAIFNLEKSKTMDNSFLKSSLVAGLCYSRLNNIKAAENNFINVLMNETFNKVALTALSILYYNQGRLNESLKLINRIISKFPPSENIKKLKYNILLQSCLNGDSTCEIKKIKNNLEKFQLYDQYIESVKIDIYTDKYGTISDKIKILEEKNKEDSQSLISLSLCHLFKGNTDSAIDYLFEAKRIATG